MSRDRQQEEFYKSFWDGQTEAAPDWHILDGDSRKGLSILLLGCGPGSDCWNLTSDHRVCGIEVSESGIAAARADGIDAALSSVADPFPYQNCSFDIVVAKDILEHVLDPLSVLKEVRRVLRPDGELVLLIPNHFYWPFRVRYLFGGNLVWKTLMHDQTTVFEEWDYIHVRFFTWRGVRRFLSLAGFRITKRYFNFGTLEHYFEPDRYRVVYRQAWTNGEKKSKRGMLVCYVIYPSWRVLNVVLPKRVRSRIVGIAPGFLTAAFYLRCVPAEGNGGQGSTS